VAAVGRQQERDIASFDEGELWCADDAEPPLSPAGWYYRPRRGAGAAWVGPFDDAAAAALAPASGDSLRDARRQLDRWRRGDEPPSPKLVALRRPAPLPRADAAGQYELEVGAPHSPAAAPVRRARRSATRAQQLPLALEL
jgi:hypothetical protein